MKNKVLIEHFFGLVGQISAGLPLLLITSVISKSDGLEAAGKFTVLVGLASTIYSIGLWGFRPLIVINKYNLPSNLFLISRLFLLFISAIIILIFAVKMNYFIWFAYIIIIIKSSDAIIDLDFGFLQLKSSYFALKSLAISHVSKFILIALVLTLAHFSIINNFYLLIIILGSLLFCVFILKLIIQEKINFSLESINIQNIKQLFLKSTVFLFATVLCSFLTNSPRFLLDFFNDGELLGVIGICLSVANLFGMIFNTNWQRYFSNYKTKNNLSKYGLKFIFENAFIAILLSIFVIFFLPYLVSLGFNINLIKYKDIMISVFLSYIVFNFGMSISNLYKLTQKPIFESYTYLITLILSAFLILLFPSIFKIYHLLFIAGLVMLLLSIYSFKLFKTQNNE